MTQIATFKSFESKGKVIDGKIVLPKLNQKEHDEFFNSIHHRILSSEYDDTTKTFTYVLQRKGVTIITLKQKRKYVRTKI